MFPALISAGGADPATIAFLKGKLLNIMEEFDEQAEEFLKQAVRFESTPHLLKDNTGSQKP